MKTSEDAKFEERKKRILIEDEDWEKMKAASYVTEIPYYWRSASHPDTYAFLAWCDESKLHADVYCIDEIIRNLLMANCGLNIGPGKLVYFEDVFYLVQPCIHQSVAGGERKILPNLLPTVSHYVPTACIIRQDVHVENHDAWLNRMNKTKEVEEVEEAEEADEAEEVEEVEEVKEAEEVENEKIEKVENVAKEKKINQLKPISKKNKVSPVASPAPSKGKKSKKKKWTQILSDIDQTTKGSELFHEVSTYLADNPVKRPDKNWTKVVKVAKPKLTAEEYKKFSNLRAGKSK